MLSNVKNLQVEERYVSFGFTKVIQNGRDCAQCLHCLAMMSNASLRPFKLINHRHKKNPQRNDDNLDALSAKRVQSGSGATSFGI